MKVQIEITGTEKRQISLSETIILKVKEIIEVNTLEYRNHIEYNIDRFGEINIGNRLISVFSYRIK